MSLDISLTQVMPTCVFDANITHNLGKMARAVGLYEYLWCPEELGISRAGDLIPALKMGLAALEFEPPRFLEYEAPNGWGRYCDFVPFVRKYLAACEEYPDATIRASR